MAQAIQLLINEAMKLERSAVLGAGPYERTPSRRGQANGFKPKRVRTRLGPSICVFRKPVTSSFIPLRWNEASGASSL